MPRNQSPNESGVPVLDLKRQYAEIEREIRDAVERVCASQHFVLGPDVEALEHEVAQYVGAKHGVGCASGTDALWLALAAAGVGPGDRVITTPFSFFASASSIVRAAAEPVFVDVDPETLNLDSKAVLTALEGGPTRRGEARNRNSLEPRSSGPTRAQVPQRKHIKAILPVHLYGQCADMTTFEQIASEHRLGLIEDAAQAIGAKWDGKPAGSMGLAAAFSFYPTKNLSAYGDAGIVTTSDPARADHMRRLRNHGSPERYLHTEFGWNARMDAIQAAVLRVKLKRIDDWNKRRRNHAATYSLLLKKAGLVAEAASTKGSPGSANPSNRSGFPIQTLKASPHAFHIFHQFVIRAERRDQLRAFLKSRSIGSEIYYPLPLHLQPAFNYLGYKEGDLPEAERAAKEVLALPMFPELTAAEIETVAGAIADFYS